VSSGPERPRFEPGTYRYLAVCRRTDSLASSRTYSFGKTYGHYWEDQNIEKGGQYSLQIDNHQILGLIPLVQIRKFLRCASPQISNSQIFMINPQIFMITFGSTKKERKLHWSCAADFALLNLPKGKSLGRSKPATSSYAQALQHTVWDDSYYIQALLNCLL
jgi:hypothetical protein